MVLCTSHFATRARFPQSVSGEDTRFDASTVSVGGEVARTIFLCPFGNLSRPTVNPELEYVSPLSCHKTRHYAILSAASERTSRTASQYLGRVDLWVDRRQTRSSAEH